MIPQDILKWASARPFVPFRMRLIDGRVFEARNPFPVKVGETTLCIFRWNKPPTNPHETFDGVDMTSPDWVESIEAITA